MALVFFKTRVENCVKDGLTEENIRLIVSDLEYNDVEFLDFIRCIGPGLIDPDKVPRLNATKLMSEVVSKLKASFFSHDEIEVLLKFLCDKFTDRHDIAPSSLKGIVALSQADALTPAMMKLIIHSIFENLTVQTLYWNEKSLVYSIFDFFLKNRLEELKEMNGEFVVGFKNMVDSESHAKNLIVVFDMVSTIASSIPLGDSVEELFEFISEYFPVDFTPDSNWKISKNDLSKSLKACFTSSAEFADYAIPLLIEKMSSSVIESKLDSLEYLSACCDVYNSDKIAWFSERLWNAILQNVYSPEDNLESSCLSALVAMVKNLSRDSSDHEEPNSYLIQFLDFIFRDCSRYLLDAMLELFHKSINILLTVSFATVQSSKHLLGRIIKKLILEFDIQKQAAPRAKIVKSLLLFIDKKKASIERDVQSDVGDEFKALDEILMEKKPEIINIITSIGNSQSPELKSLSLWGSVTLITLDCFSKEDKVSIVGHLTDLSIASSNEALRKSVYEPLESLSALRNDLCLKFVLPKLMSVISSELELQSGCDMAKLEHLISAVAHLSNGKDLVSTAAPELLEIINRCGKRVGSICADGLVHLVKSNLEGEAMEFIGSQFMSDCRDSILNLDVSTDESPATETEKTLEGLSTCIRMAVEADVGSALSFAEEVAILFLDNAEKHEADDEKTCTRRLLHLVLASICSIKDQEQLKSIESVTRSCFKLARSSKDIRTTAVASKCFACLINKTSQGPFLDEMVNEAEDKLLAVLSANSTEADEVLVRNCILWSWMTKALVARNHDRQMLFCNQLVDMLSLTRLSRPSSEGFRIVLSDFDDVLSPKSHSNVTILHKQRFFSFTIHRLIDSFHVCEKELKKNFIEALSSLNRFVPKQVVHQELKLILPLLVLSLSSKSSPEVWMSSMPVLHYFIRSSPHEIEKYFDDFLPRLLEISRYPDKMTIRMEALKCLALMPERLTQAVVLPRQKQVIRKISESLQDHKRLVRQQASIANCAWHMAGQPCEEKEEDEE